MLKSSNHQQKRDLLKLSCLVSVTFGVGAIFIFTPAILYPTLFAMMIAIVLSPVADFFERKGYSRTFSLLIIFSGLLCLSAVVAFYGIQKFMMEWDQFKEQAPQDFKTFIDRLKVTEAGLKAHYPFLANFHGTDSLIQFGNRVGTGFVDAIPVLASQVVSWSILVPALSFFLLKDGGTIERLFFQLVPNRYFESIFLITTDISTALSNYVRAKLLEAMLVGLLVFVGLLLVGSSHSLILGVFAGLTNIVPYIGPILGAVPGVLIASLDPANRSLLFLVTMVYSTANIIDGFLIFPYLVGKLINIHPLLLIISITLGQEYYGVIGMLCSVPIAATLKVIFLEIYTAIYEQRSPESFSPHTPLQFPIHEN